MRKYVFAATLAVGSVAKATAAVSAKIVVLGFAMDDWETITSAIMRWLGF